MESAKMQTIKEFTNKSGCNITLYKEGQTFFVEVLDINTGDQTARVEIFQNLKEKFIEENLNREVQLIERNDGGIVLEFEILANTVHLPWKVFLEPPQKEVQLLKLRVHQLEKELAAMKCQTIAVANVKEKVFTGKTSEDDWKTYSQDGITTAVDISHLKLTKTPIVVTSLVGTRDHWTTTGATSIYCLTNTQFQVYVKGGTLSSAQQYRWHLNYVVYSQD